MFYFNVGDGISAGVQTMFVQSVLQAVASFRGHGIELFESQIFKQTLL